MLITKPQVHLRRHLPSLVYRIHVITWMDITQFVAAGSEALPVTATNGVFEIVLNVIKDPNIPEMKLLTPVVHTLSLDGIDLTDENPFISVKVNDITGGTLSLVGERKKTHKDDADDSTMPGIQLINPPKIT